ARGAADRRARGPRHRQDGVVEALDRRGIRRRQLRDELRSAAIAAVRPRGGLGAIAEVAEDRPAPAPRALDVRPDLAVLLPTHPRGLGDRGPAPRLGPSVELAHDPA